MKKKYQAKELISLNEKYLSTHPFASGKFLHFYPTLGEISCSRLHKTYLKDFYFKFHNQQEKSQTSYLFSPSDINSFALENLQHFFSKKRLSLPKLGNAKIFHYLDSKKQKGKRQNKNRIKTMFHESIDFNDQETFSLFLRKKFFQLREQGKIKTKKQIGYRSFALQENVPAERVVLKTEIKDKYYLKYFIEGKGVALTVVAFDVDLIFGDVALLVHPGDKRYKQYIGKNVLIPLINKAIPVLGDESVDISKDEGIVRVNPFLNQESIDFAEKHGLDLDCAVFDMQGNYTALSGKFIGKPRLEFQSNMLDFLYDIANIGEVRQGETVVPYSVTTGERLSYYLLDTFYLDLDQEKEIFRQWIENHAEELGDNKEALLEILDHEIIINAYAGYGEKIPVYLNGKFQLANLPFGKEEYPDPLTSLFDQFLFFIANLFYPFKMGNFSQFISYLVDFHHQLPFFFESLSDQEIDPQVKSDFSSFFEGITMAEEDSLEKVKNLIDHSKLFSISVESVECKFLTEEKGKFLPMIFSDVFLQVMRVLFFQQQGETFADNRFFSQDEMSFGVFYALISLMEGGKIPYQDLTFSPLSFENQKEDTMLLDELIKKFGDDVVRMNFLVDQHLDKEKCNEYAIFLGKLWNGVRYRKQYFPKFNSFDEALKTALSSDDQMDIWILCELSDLYQNYQTKDHYQKALNFFPEVMHFTQKKLLSRYFELKKEKKSESASAVLQVCFSFILDYMYLFVPTYLRTLLESIGAEYPLFHSFTGAKVKSNDCVRLYNLWNLFFGFKTKLGYKKHDPIKVFIKSDPGILELYKEYQEFFEKMFIIQEQILLRLHENEPEGYEQELFETYTIGIKKGESKIIGKKQMIADLEHKKKEKEQYLEYVKNLYLSGYPSFGATIQELKQELENIEMEIQKLKKNVE